MVTLQSVQGHSGLTHLFNFLTFGHSGAQYVTPKCPKGWLKERFFSLL